MKQYVVWHFYLRQKSTHLWKEVMEEFRLYSLSSTSSSSSSSCHTKVAVSKKSSTHKKHKSNATTIGPGRERQWNSFQTQGGHLEFYMLERVTTQSMFYLSILSKVHMIASRVYLVNAKVQRIGLYWPLGHVGLPKLARDPTPVLQGGTEWQ